MKKKRLKTNTIFLLYKLCLFLFFLITVGKGIDNHLKHICQPASLAGHFFI